MDCVVEYGLDGNLYAVFKSNIDAEDYAEHFYGCPVACFGNYENAYQLTDNSSTGE